MRAKELPRKIVYLDLFNSLLEWDGGESRARGFLLRDFPWVFEEGWELERWGLRRRNSGRAGREPSSLRGPTFPFLVFPRVLLPVVIWATHFVQSLLRPRAGIFVAHSPVTALGAAAAGLFRRRSSPLVVRIVSDSWSSRARALGGRRLEPRIVQALERFVLRRADLVIPIGPFTHEIARRFGTPEERILDQPRLTSWFGMEVIPAEENGSRRVACAGRLIPDKGFDVLLAAFSEIAGEFPDVQLDVAGDGPERSKLDRQATSLGIADRVRFRGWVNASSMAGFYGGALMSVLPSPMNEGLPTVLLEAALAGCALIGADVGGVRDIVHPDRTGILVPPNDAGALADALRTLLRDPEKAKRLGVQAQAEARAHFRRRDEAVRQVRDRMNALRSARR